ncbi:hypothetical protein [Amycolatopsis sp. lyj-23]|uniref:hypothetical protein n=1 Tax=Amycolatopsis sp. lyj-23 TaxID=2789283 RepID=UPI00397975F4
MWIVSKRLPERAESYGIFRFEIARLQRPKEDSRLTAMKLVAEGLSFPEGPVVAPGRVGLGRRDPRPDHRADLS